ncbi:DUF3945 domain-containing protein [Rhodocytophaga aerolata]|uniref:DUF3945 domain-containing protein n=1 Tax=Rhodocytophaga aerolata TaxID=455078 RepID=A0ABT8RF73_9BACT|nr:DUF3945 domain-containing protein [Rhodocytophaga aerolata]MDO1450720.1 DUF3945 domain-containing protein [Rhodocytophaga aerolata]
MGNIHLSQYQHLPDENTNEAEKKSSNQVKQTGSVYTKVDYTSEEKISSTPFGEEDDKTKKKKNKAEVGGNLDAAGKEQKGLLEDIEVLANRSILTNFLHNYAKAKNDMMTEQSVQSSEKWESKSLTGEENNSTLKIETPFQSYLQTKHLKPDWERINRIKEDGQGFTYKNLLANNSIIGEKKQHIPSETHENDQSNESPKNQVEKKIFTLQDVPVKQFEKLGISQEHLIKNGMLEKLLKGEKTLPVDNLQWTNQKGEILKYSATFFLEKKPDGTATLKLNYQPHTLINKIPTRILGFELSNELKNKLGDKEMVALKGNISKGEGLSFLQFDRFENKLQLIKPDSFRLPREINGVRLSDEHQKILKEGKEIKLSGMTATDGNKTEAIVRLNFSQKAIQFSSLNPATSLLQTATLIRSDINSTKQTKGLIEDTQVNSDKKTKGQRL